MGKSIVRQVLSQMVSVSLSKLPRRADAASGGDFGWAHARILPEPVLLRCFERKIAALTHDPAESRLFAGSGRFRRLRGQIALGGRQSGACDAGGSSVRAAHSPFFSQEKRAPPRRIGARIMSWSTC